jgi:S-adenosylmethionine:diacylglycerol 3-amino-3-carboxypropyl transferase
LSSNPKSIIRYSQCWEDSEIVLQSLDVKTDDVVFSIASGGENVFAMMSKTENEVFAIDYNPSQIFLVNLKFIAIKNLDFDQYLEFIGIKKCKNRKQIFNQLALLLDKKTTFYFQNNIKLIERGVIHIGKFDKYLQVFSKRILPFLVSSTAVKKAIATDNQESQYNTYQKIWNNWRWRLIGEQFFGKSVMQKMGRHKVMFKYNDKKSTGSIYLDRAEEFLKNGSIHKNHYLDYILTGNFSNNLHYYLKKEVFQIIKNKQEINLLNSDILTYLKTMPDNSFNKFNLSDVFESMNNNETEAVFKEILRTATNNARIIFWNNLVERDIPTNLKPNFEQDIELQNKLSSLEKVFFYNRFFIYKISK